jgi:RNA polymerase sigma-70 factor, ECF subfamily
MDPFKEIYERHYAAVYRFALFLTGDAAAADDLTSDTFLRALRNRRTIREATVRAYLLTIARNRYRDGLRSKNQFVELDAQHANAEISTDERYEQQARIDHACALLANVTIADRRALLLRVVGELSYQDIARTLGITVGAVKSRISRARLTLKRLAGGCVQETNQCT